MSLEKQTVVDSIETTENCTVQVRTATRVIEDGVVVSQSLHRHTIVPGQDYSQEDARVQAICAAVHTPSVISAYETSIANTQGV